MFLSGLFLTFILITTYHNDVTKMKSESYKMKQESFLRVALLQLEASQTEFIFFAPFIIEVTNFVIRFALGP